MGHRPHAMHERIPFAYSRAASRLAPTWPAKRLRRNSRARCTGDLIAASLTCRVWAISGFYRRVTQGLGPAGLLTARALPGTSRGGLLVPAPRAGYAAL